MLQGLYASKGAQIRSNLEVPMSQFIRETCGNKSESSFMLYTNMLQKGYPFR